MLTGVCRLVLEVADLRQARQTYAALGFELVADTNAIAAHNAEDSLLLVQAAGAVEGLRWIDIASDDLVSDIAAMRSRGVQIGAPEPLDAGLLGAVPDSVNPLPLRLVQRGLGVPRRPAGLHPNGISHLDRVYLVYQDAWSQADVFGRFLGMPVPPLQRGRVINANMAIFNIGQTGIGVATPVEPGPAAEALEARGPGPFQGLYRTRSMCAAVDWMVRHGLPAPARGVRNNGEAAILVERTHACGMYLALVGPE